MLKVDAPAVSQLMAPAEERRAQWVLLVVSKQEIGCPKTVSPHTEFGQGSLPPLLLGAWDKGEKPLKD